MTRIGVVIFKRNMPAPWPFFNASVCENGIWLRAVFRYSEQNMRWERVSG